MCHVLVIEDEWAIADTICECLESVGATSFDIAVTERDAIQLAARHVPDVITSDVRLIEGTGPKAVASICRSLGNIPTIFITASPADCKPCELAIAVLQKPFTMTALTDAFAMARARS